MSVKRTTARIHALLDVASRPLATLEIARITRCGPATLYRALRRLEGDGLITSEWEEEPTPDGLPRRRFYQINR